MNIYFSFNTSYSFLCKSFPGNRLFSAQSRLSVGGKPLLRSRPPPIHKPEPQADPPSRISPSHFSPIPNSVPYPNFDSNDFTAICDLLTNPSFPPGPALESALDQSGIELVPSLLQQIFDRYGSSPKLLLTLFLWAERQPWFRSSVGTFNAMIKVLARAREFQSAWSIIFGRLKKQTEGPDVDTFAILIRRYARRGIAEEANMLVN